MSSSPHYRSLSIAPDLSIVIEEEFCGDCGRSIGFDLRPLTLRCPVCALIHDAQEG